MFLRKLRLAMRWRYELYFSEYIDLFGSISYFVKYLVDFYKLRNQKVVYVYANKRNIGDYISHLGVKHIVDIKGASIICSPVGQFWYTRQLRYLRQHNPSCHLVIGGGGLFQGVFENFWQELTHSELSFSIVGVGVNVLEGRRELSNELFKKVVDTATIIAVRDGLTAGYVKSHTHTSKPILVHCCPSLNYLTHLLLKKEEQVKYLLHMVHPSDIRLSGIDIHELREIVKQVALSKNLVYKEFTNMDKEHRKGVQLVHDAACVVTTRLHGAIMSYAFGVTAACIVCDKKMEGFLATHLAVKGISSKEITNGNGFNILKSELSQAEQQQRKVTESQLLKNDQLGNVIQQHLLSCGEGNQALYVNHQ
ncbi:MAG: hypothetical protein GJ671_08725 [Alteromonadaceae bacterium]|nr:hypothetical protein [Alteromonadaceae bacterium]